ncbi:MAG: hypothetical protein EZS28_015452 [Streblomastix strix]|uniref:Uncharacterized protein n=1 Tax=Streblomastix strix TaxID=222440 RepID=A0A5J4W2V5_9EUKA|nr:MAG: hypothetical protein EZS28_015452 [Streblomastix strix]
MCLDFIHKWGDEQAQVELVTNGYPRALVIDINTAGGNEQQDDWQIGKGLENIFEFIKTILKGRQTDPDFNPGPSLQPQPVTFKSCQEQIENEGSIEEIEAQLVNEGQYYYYFDVDAKDAKTQILNFYVDRSNPEPDWYNW